MIKNVMNILDYIFKSKQRENDTTEPVINAESPKVVSQIAVINAEEIDSLRSHDDMAKDSPTETFHASAPLSHRQCQPCGCHTDRQGVHTGTFLRGFKDTKA